MRYQPLGVGLTALVLVAAPSWSAPPSFVQEETLQVTHAHARAQTTRSSGRCICTDADGNAHMAWEDARHMGQFEVYYTSTSGDSILPEVRITNTPVESSYPAIACNGRDVYIVWEEVVGRDSEIFCAHLRGREEIARVQVTDTNLDSSCPVCAVGPDGAVHVAWHEGPFKQTAIYYAKIVDDRVVETVPIYTRSPEAFRPDIACDSEGRVLIVWFDGLSVKSRLWDGQAWGDEQLVAELLSRPWRLSVTAVPGGTWAAAWFDRAETGEEVCVGFFDGDKWYGQTTVSTGRAAYYPNITALDDGGLVIGWEERVPEQDQHTVVIRTFDGKNWGQPMEIYRHHVNGRYVSVASHGDVLHAIWFSSKSGSNEIYYSKLIRKR
jgi:hypothetical protein